MKKILTPFLLSLTLSSVLPVTHGYAVIAGEEEVQNLSQGGTPQTVQLSMPFAELVKWDKHRKSVEQLAVEKKLVETSLFQQYGLQESNGALRLLTMKEIGPVWADFATQMNLLEKPLQESADEYVYLSAFLEEHGFVPFAQVAPTPVQQIVQKITLGHTKIPQKDRYTLILGERATLAQLQEYYNIEPSTCTKAYVYEFMSNNQGPQHSTSTTLRTDTAWQILCLIAGYDFYHDTNNCFFRDPSQYIKNIFNKLNQIEDSVRLLGGSKNLMKNNSW